MMKANYLTAICFDADNKAYKYRHLPKEPKKLESFYKFCLSVTPNKPAFIYINFYDHNKEFLNRHYL